MEYVAPYGSLDPNAPYVNGNPSTGQMGSIPPAAAFEHPQREILALIAAAALTPAGADLSQLLRAVRKFGGGYFVPAGTANAITITPSPAFQNLTQLVGVPLRIVAGATNTGPATLNVNGLGALAIQRRNGAALTAGDIVIGQIFQVTYNGTIFQLVTQLETFFVTQAFAGAGGQAGFSGSLVVPTGVTRMFIRAWGAGGGGGGAVFNASGGGGGGGGYAENWFPVLPGATLTIQAGTGGAAGGSGLAGGNGTGSFVSAVAGPVTGVFLSAGGGGGGGGAASATTVGAFGTGGTTSGGSFQPAGGAGQAGQVIGSNYYGGFGGASPLAGGGGYPSAQGAIFGSGGGGGTSNTAAPGTGAGGLVTISW
ncbi:hypothetical protein [Bosea sp. BK604]|uniref:hypothetical protein n=1 Tax=Bosea sp. BK604 TaxID=2512180 RepID=UPI00104393A7|nr:hypothetical protein [Bosea sp. BK604]TCR60929.1 hypothetical protein EV560_115154 [Bosea sp. BK604]